MSNLRPQILPTAFAVFALCLLALPAHGGLIAHYTFDDTTDATSLGLDSVGTHHLTPSGTPTDATGKFGSAVDTTSGFLYRVDAGANDPAFQPSAGQFGAEFAISFWYMRNGGGSGVPVGRGDIGPISGSPNSGYAALIVDGPSNPTFALANKDKIFQLSRGYDPTNLTPATNSATLPGDDDSVFHHVVIQRIRDPDAPMTDFLSQMWLDGVQAGTDVVDNGSLDTALSLSVGADIIRSVDGFNFGTGLGIADVPSSLNFAGLVDDVQVYDMGLSESEIVLLAGGGPPPGGGNGGVPEPSTFVLLLLGCLGLRRMRRHCR